MAVTTVTTVTTVTLLLSTYLPIQSIGFTRFSHLPTYPGSSAVVYRPPIREGAGTQHACEKVLTGVLVVCACE